MRPKTVRVAFSAPLIALIAATSFFLAGCGGGGSSGATPTSFASCLSAAGYEPSSNKDDMDYVAQDAGVGAVVSDIGRNNVTVVFERSDGDSERTMKAYEFFAEAFDSPVNDILTRDGSVVILWERTPTSDERSTVTDCLTKSSTSAAAATTATTDKAAVYTYPEEFTRPFMENFDTNAAKGRCILAYAQARWSIDEFVIIGKAEPTDPRFDEAIDACR